MQKTKYCILILFFFAAVTAGAQKFFFKNYTMQDGLVSSQVRNIYQDKKGFIWIATWEGLSKYDGHKFTNFTMANGLSHNLVNDVFELSPEKILVAENNNDIDIIENEKIAGKIRLSELWPVDKFANNVNGKTLAGAGGIYEITQRGFTKKGVIDQSFNYSYFTTVNDSLILAGNINNAVLHLLDKNYTVIAITNLPGTLLHCLYTDSKKRIWAGTNAGLKQIIVDYKKPVSLKITTPPSPFNINNIAGLESSQINTIIEDAEKNLWLGTVSGLIRISANNNLQLYKEKDGLPSSTVNAIYEDKEKNLWIGTASGLAKLNAQISASIYIRGQNLEQNFYPKLNLLNNEELYIHTDKKTWLFNNTVSRFEEVPHIGSNRFSALYKNDYSTLVYDRVNEKIKYSTKKDTKETLPKMTDIFCMTADASGIIIIGSFDGLHFFNGNAKLKSKTINHRIQSVLVDKKGDLWAATWKNGLYKIIYSRQKDSLISTVENFTHVLPDKEIRCLFEDHESNIWAGTRFSGVAQLKKLKNGQFKCLRWGEEQGLFCNFIRVITEDKENNIWVGSLLGLDKLVKRDTGYNIFNFSMHTNLYADITDLVVDSKKTLWALADQNLLRIQNSHFENLPPIPVYITSALLGTEKQKYISDSSNIKLSHRNNQAYFEFSAPGFINEKQIRYSYRLSGSADTLWSQPANLNSVPYASLSPGKYRFEVHTVAWDGKYSPSAFFAFEITPPFWQTWWFIILCICGAGFLFYLFYRYRINQLLKMQQVRNRIATDLHDDIGSSLTNISMLSELSKKNIAQPEKASLFINRISEEVNTSGQALDDIVWSINAHNDSLEQLEARMRRYAAEVFDGANINYSSAMDEQFASQKLDMDKRRDLFLIFKELINNICRHAVAKNVALKLAVEKGRVLLTITDDGKGFDTNAPTHRNGLKNIQLRVIKWKGQAKIISAVGAGTTAAVYIPL